VYRDGKLVRTVTDTWAPIYGLTAGPYYSFTVEAVNDAGGSGQSAALTVRSALAFASAPAAIEEVHHWGWGTGRIRLNWKVPANVTDGHLVYVDGVLAGWVKHMTAEVSGLAPGTYTVEVTSLNSAGESPKSPPVQVTVEE
jgi:predicted phage tail protein